MGLEIQTGPLSRENEIKIALYLPHGRDPALAGDEYYILNSAEQVRRVRLAGLCCRHGYPRPVAEVVGVNKLEEYKNVFEADGCFRFGQLYDNAEDCAARTHDDYDLWERLRLLQAAHEAWMKERKSDK